jgi:hypothetical protein
MYDVPKSLGSMAIMVVSSSSVSMYSTRPSMSRSVHVNLFWSGRNPCSCEMWCFLIASSWSFTMKSGRHIRPASVYMRTSDSGISRTMLTSASMSIMRRNCRNV